MHVYIHIYIPTRMYWWCVHTDTGYIARRQQSTHPPAAGPRATPPGVSLSDRGAPFGVDPPSILPGRADWPAANWPIPRLAPSVMTAPGNAPRARQWPTANWRVLSPATITCAAPPPPLPLASFVRPPRARPQSSHLPRPTGPPSHPLDPPRRRRREPPSLAHGPRAHAHACPPWPSLRRAPVPPRGVRGWGAACNGSRPAASPSSHHPRRAAP